jgi:hypothetical protein
MNEQFLPQFLLQLVRQAPVLLVGLVALVLAALYLRRWPKPATLTLIATALLIVNGVGGAFVYVYLISQRSNETPQNVAFLIGIFTMGASVVRAVGMALIVAAVFSGRPAPLYPSEPMPFKNEGPFKV